MQESPPVGGSKTFQLKSSSPLLWGCSRLRRKSSMRSGRHKSRSELAINTRAHHAQSSTTDDGMESVGRRVLSTTELQAMTFHAFDLWVAMITVGALGGLLLGPFPSLTNDRHRRLAQEKSNDRPCD